MMSFIKSTKTKQATIFLSGIMIGFCSNMIYKNIYKSDYSFEKLSKQIPEEKKFKNEEIKHAHSQILANADEFITKTKSENRECSFSLVLLKNENENIDKKWVTFYQASDKPEAVADMKRVTEEHLKKYVSSEPETEIKIESYS
jgi:hypothetical protein